MSSYWHIAISAKWLLLSILIKFYRLVNKYITGRSQTWTLYCLLKHQVQCLWINSVFVTELEARVYTLPIVNVHWPMALTIHYICNTWEKFSHLQAVLSTITTAGSLKPKADTHKSGNGQTPIKEEERLISHTSQQQHKAEHAKEFKSDTH